jgi:hypothetical protein
MSIILATTIIKPSKQLKPFILLLISFIVLIFTILIFEQLISFHFQSSIILIIFFLPQFVFVFSLLPLIVTFIKL